MSKSRHRQKKPLLGWCSGNMDNMEDRFIQLGASFFEHPNVQALTRSELVLYLLMVKAAKGSREFTFPRSEYAPYFSKETFHNAKCGLVEKKFIEVVYSGKCTREPNRYRFVFGWKENTKAR